MSYREPVYGRLIAACFMAAFLLITSSLFLYAEDNATNLNKIKPRLVRSLPSSSCPGTSSTYCHRSSPVLADLTGDGKLEIVVATNNGNVLAIKHDGSTLWSTDVGPAFGMGAGKQVIASSPAVADIDKDGKMEVVVGTGTIYPSVCTKGGIIVLDHNGHIEPGWPIITQDEAIAPAGCPDSIYATPALGDLDKDGDLEIVVGGFDKRLYALHHNGKLVAGFPPNSHHYRRFGWDELYRQLADEVWSSPALADMNGDGYLEIITGTEEGNFDSRWQPVVGNWSCPYRAPITPGYCGGSIYVFDRFGRTLEGFPRYKYEDIQSSPAIMDMNSDGRPEIFVGTGSWNYRKSPDHPTLGFRLFGMDNKGNDLSGWQGGKVVGGFVAASPSLGDITGDGKPNIVVAASDKRLYAWHTNGQLVAGFPMTPRTHRSRVLDGYNVGATFILADYTGDGKMEIIFRHAWEINIVNGKGKQLTASSLDGPGPTYITKGTIMNNPVVGDLDGDGHLELVVQNSELTVWDLPNSSDQASWPMFKNNSARTSVLQPSVRIAPQDFSLLADQKEGNNYNLHTSFYGDLGSFNWSASSSQPARIQLPLTAGVFQGKAQIPVSIKVPGGLPVGEHHFGDITVTISQGSAFSETKNIPVKVRVMRLLHQAYLPLVR